MLNAEDLIKLIKRTAMDAVTASKPCNALIGKVVQTDPLKILVDQKLVLGKAQLLLSRHVTDHTMKLGDTEYTVENALKAGESVVMLQSAGGQRYVVLDRLGVGA